MMKTAIRTKDGQEIAARLYLPESGEGDVLLIGSSAAVTQDFYRDFAKYLAGRGFVVVTFDYRGTGKSANGALKHSSASLQKWGTLDLDAVILFLKNTFPKQEIHYLGHGMGGQLVGLAPASQFLSRLVFVNAALTCWRKLPSLRQAQIFSLSLLRRATTKVLGYFPGKKIRFLQDLPSGVMSEYANWCDQPDGLFDLYPDHNFRKLKSPLLALSFADDWLSPAGAVGALLRHFSNADISWSHRTPGDMKSVKVGHSGFFQIKFRETLWREIEEWLEQ